ncbi:MAG: MFS transporter, partial [Chloroflexota bacterium]|nr:MFS transporter [Chloroflexota bacterium]
MTFRHWSIFQSDNYKWWAFCAIAVGLFTSVADAGSVVVALPTIGDHFGADLPTAQWVVTGYALTISAFLLPMGRLSDVMGRKRIYVLGFLVFAGGAAAA